MNSRIITTFLTGLLIFSCACNPNRPLKNNISVSEKLPPASTEFEFPELNIPPGFYLDSLSIFDSLSTYDLCFLQSSLPELKKINQAMLDQAKKLIQNEQVHLASSDEGEFINTGFTYYIRPLAIYLNENVVSITHIIDTYMGGANHHNYSWFTFNYDLKRNRLIRFSDIFNLPYEKDTVAFIDFVYRHRGEDCMDLPLPFDSVDFSFANNGIYINPELSWACALNRSLLPADSLDHTIQMLIK